MRLRQATTFSRPGGFETQSRLGSMSSTLSKYNERVRTLRKLHRRWREARMFASAMVSTDHPIVAQVVPIRRCNLSCAYCNEFDKTSEPVAVSVIMRRI